MMQTARAGNPGEAWFFFSVRILDLPNDLSGLVGFACKSNLSSFFIAYVVERRTIRDRASSDTCFVKSAICRLGVVLF